MKQFFKLQLQDAQQRGEKEVKKEEMNNTFNKNMYKSQNTKL